MRAAPSPRRLPEPVAVASRAFEASRARLWAACTDPGQVPLWWTPEGHKSLRCELDVRPGGGWRIDQRGPDGALYAHYGEYREIEAAVWIVNTQHAPGLPPLLVTFAFDDDEAGARMTEVIRLGVPSPLDPDLGSVLEQGASAGLARLARLLASG